MHLNWINTASGFGVGLLVGLTGVGGGSLMMPIMVLLFGMAPSIAVGTDLWFAAITKIVGAWIHDRKGTVDWQILRRMFCGSLPAALLTLFWLHATGAPQSRNQLIFKTLGVTLMLTSAATVFRGRLHAFGTRMWGERPAVLAFVQPALTVLAGAILGFLVTFTSIGAGALGAVMLLYLYPLRLTASALVGTDIVHAIPLTILAGTGHLFLGNVDFGLLVNLLLGSIPGIALGAMGSTHVPEKILRAAISLILAALGLKMVLT